MATALFISRLSLVEIITSFGGDIMEYLSHISRAGNFHFPHILYKQYKCSRRKPMELWSNQFCWWSQFTPHTPTFSGILNFSSSSHHKHRAGIRIKGLKFYSTLILKRYCMSNRCLPLPKHDGEKTCFSD